MPGVNPLPTRKEAPEGRGLGRIVSIAGLGFEINWPTISPRGFK